MIPKEIFDRLLTAVREYAANKGITEDTFPAFGQEDGFIKLTDSSVKTSWISDNISNPKLAVWTLLKIIRLTHLPSPQYFNFLKEAIKKISSNSWISTAKQFAGRTAQTVERRLSSSPPSASYFGEKPYEGSNLREKFNELIPELERRINEIYEISSTPSNISPLQEFARYYVEIAWKLDTTRHGRYLGYETFREEVKDKEYNHALQYFLKSIQSLYKQHFDDEINNDICFELAKRLVTLKGNLPRDGAEAYKVDLEKQVEEIFKTYKAELSEKALKKELAEAKEAKKSLEEKCKDEHAELEEMKKKLELLTAAQVQHSQAFASHTKECDELRGKFKESSEALERYRKETEEKTRELTALNVDLARISHELEAESLNEKRDQARIKVLEAQSSERQKTIEERSKLLSSREQMLGTLRQKCEAVQVTLEQKEELLKQLQAALEDKDTKIRSLTAERDQAKQTASKVAQQLLRERDNKSIRAGNSSSKGRFNKSKDRGAQLGFDPEILAGGIEQPDSPSKKSSKTQ